KGGTSLSKAYHLINRFSEDIYLSYYSENHQNIGTSKRKKLTKSIKESLKENGFTLLNEEEIKSGYMFNKFEVNYDSLYNDGNVLRPTLLVETYYQFSSFPVFSVTVDSYIYQMALEKNAMDLLERYAELPTFQMNVQSLERTFSDKIFAICDHFLKKDASRHSRHLYDLYFLYKNGNMDFVLLKTTFEEVRKILQSDLERNPSSASGVEISKTLYNLLECDFYKEDYDRTTTLLVGEGLNYDIIKHGLTEMIEALKFL